MASHTPKADNIAQQKEVFVEVQARGSIAILADHMVEASDEAEAVAAVVVVALYQRTIHWQLINI